MFAGIASLLTVMHNPELCFELGVVSKLVYKNASAHGRHKYFQALKKIDRHMRQFASLQLNSIIKQYLSEPNAEATHVLEDRLMIASKVLSCVEENCSETIKHCLPQLALKHFVTLHVLHVVVVSKIWSCVENMKQQIMISLKKATEDQSLKNDLVGQEGSDKLFAVNDVGNKLDVGVAVSRPQAMQYSSSAGVFKTKSYCIVTAEETPDKEETKDSNEKCESVPSSGLRRVANSKPYKFPERLRNTPIYLKHYHWLFFRLSKPYQFPERLRNTPIYLKRYHQLFFRLCQNNRMRTRARRNYLPPTKHPRVSPLPHASSKGKTNIRQLETPGRGDIGQNGI